MALNGISTSTYKADRQLAKLALAQAKRQGKVVEDNGTWTGSIDPTKPYYRARNSYIIDELPTVYTSGDNNTNDVTDNPNLGGLALGRPWNTISILAGLWRSTYNGYYDNDPTWFDTQTPMESTPVNNFDLYDGDVFSSQWLGYFQAPHTATYTFYRSSDDASSMWLGGNAITGYTDLNQFEGTIALEEGELVPIRLQYGNAGGAKYLNVSWSDDYSTNATITIPDLGDVVSGPVSGSTYTNGGGYDYVAFTSTPTLTGAIITQYGITPDNNSFFHAYPVTWAPGSDSANGYVYLQVTSTSSFQFYSSDIDGNPLAGTWVFPMRFETV